MQLSHADLDDLIVATGEWLSGRRENRDGEEWKRMLMLHTRLKVRRMTTQEANDEKIAENPPKTI